MTPIFRVLGLAGATLVAGCASEAVKHAAYETLQNVGQQQCEKSLSSDCDKRIDYDVYQREREKLNTPVPQGARPGGR
jgi:hypothetical protein